MFIRPGLCPIFYRFSCHYPLITYLDSNRISHNTQRLSNGSSFAILLSNTSFANYQHSQRPRNFKILSTNQISTLVLVSTNLKLNWSRKYQSGLSRLFCFVFLFRCWGMYATAVHCNPCVSLIAFASGKVGLLIISFICFFDHI